MADLVIERVYAVTKEHLFKAVTQASSLAAWFGPEGINVVEHELRFENQGPWFAKLTGSDGKSYKMSGVVTHFNAPHSVSFTWAWHDENDIRGHESNVIFEVSDMNDGTSKLTLSHANLQDDEQSKNHNIGWTSSLTKLPAVLGL